MTAEEVEQALRSRFASPKYAFITGVRNDAGFAADRTCDALAIGTWNSTGLDLNGIEIKVGRGDWIREIQDPTKADAFACYCDYWWIAAPPKIVKLEELPATWGLLEVVGNGTKVRKPPTRNATPTPISRGFLVAIARRVTEQSPAEQQLKDAIHTARKEAREEAKREYDGFGSYEAKANAKYAANLHALEQAANVRIFSEGDAAEMGKRVKEFLETEDAIDRARRELQYLRTSARNTLDGIESALLQERPKKR